MVTYKRTAASILKRVAYSSDVENFTQFANLSSAERDFWNSKIANRSYELGTPAEVENYIRMLPASDQHVGQDLLQKYIQFVETIRRKVRQPMAESWV